MGFFKKLKDKLFTLNVEDKPKIEKKIVSPQEEKEAIDRDLDRASEKLEKKIEKEKQKELIKSGKVDKYVAGLSKTSSSFAQRIKEIQSRHNQIDEEFFDELEEALIMADISANLVVNIIDEIKKTVKIENVVDPKLISEIIADKLFTIYTNQSIVDTTLNIQDNRLNVVIVVGVNGAGKTTSIAKIAYSLLKQGKKVLIAAGDTFRAGAVEQLGVWAERIGAQIVKPAKEGADPASVVFDALRKAKTENFDVLIVDTAGRLQNKVNLMNELEKISKILQREVPDAPHESLLVLDATTGQNGVSQAMHFKEVTPLTGIVLTKMDGTSKGGIVFTIKDKLQLAVKLIGLGEALEDLQEFDLEAFIYGLTKDLADGE